MNWAQHKTVQRPMPRAVSLKEVEGEGYAADRSNLLPAHFTLTALARSAPIPDWSHAVAFEQTIFDIMGRWYGAPILSFNDKEIYDFISDKLWGVQHIDAVVGHKLYFMRREDAVEVYLRFA